jgi:hypothetical protein
VVVAGTRTEKEESPAWICEIDADGAVRTERTLPQDVPNEPPSVVLSTADGTLVGGHDGEAAAWVATLSNEGETRWVRRYRPDGGSGGLPRAIIPTQSPDDTTYTLVSKRESYDDWRDSAWLLRFDSDGRVCWSRTYDASVSFIDGAYAPDASTFLLAGKLNGTAGVESPAGVIAIENGGIAWRRTYPANWFWDIAPAFDDSSEAIAVGHVSRDDRDDVGVVARLGAQGGVHWWRTLSSDRGSIICNNVRPTSQGYLITGRIRRSERDDVQFFGTLGPDGSRCQCYTLDQPQGAQLLLTAEQLLSVDEVRDGAVLRSLGRR